MAEAAGPVTETELLALVTAACSRRGLLWHHCDDSRRCIGRKGFLDLVIIGRRLMVAELKGPDGETSPDQDLWIWHYHQAGIGFAVWDPADWESGAIADALNAL